MAERLERILSSLDLVSLDGQIDSLMKCAVGFPTTTNSDAPRA